MKCLCGYEYIKSYIKGKPVISKGDKDFVLIESQKRIQVPIFENDKCGNLYACPVCGLVYLKDIRPI